MQDALTRLDILMGDTQQILDHMKVDSEYVETLANIKKGLEEERRKIEDINHHTGESQTNAAVSMTQNLARINDMVQKLEAKLLNDYQKSTDDQIDQYEEMSLEEQMEQKETYHDKIDYLSAAKIRDNINRMNEVLLRFNS